MADREKNRVRRKYKKIEYLENEKSFLDEIKNIFHSFWRSISFGEKYKFVKKWRTQALTCLTHIFVLETPVLKWCEISKPLVRNSKQNSYFSQFHIAIHIIDKGVAIFSAMKANYIHTPIWPRNNEMYNHLQNVLRKTTKSSKVGQERKILIFALVYFSRASAKNLFLWRRLGTMLCPNGILRFC